MANTRTPKEASPKSTHAIGGHAPHDTDSRFCMAAQRVKLLGIAAEAISHSESDLGLPDGEVWRTLGLMLQELADEIDMATETSIAQANARA